MRVLHLTTEFPPIIYGGLGTAIGGLVHASARAGIDVAVLLVGGRSNSSYWSAPEAKQLPEAATSTQGEDPGIRLLHASYQEALEMGVRWLRGWKPDVLHLHSFWLWPLARELRKRTGVPLVYTVHSLDRAEYEIGQGPPECLAQWDTQQELIASADLVVALTRSERELVETYCPTARSRVRIVGNGIEDRPDALAATKRALDHNPLCVLFSGRFVDRKGVHELMAAIPVVLDRSPDTCFVFAGGHRHCSGDEMARHWLPAGLEKYRAQVHFTGWLSTEQLAMLYRAADILVVPSWYEPFGMVILEGMLFGLPIAASSVGGPAEILDHGRTGLLFPPRDAVGLAQALIRLIQFPALRQRLGQAAAREVRQSWLYTRVIERMREVYIEVMSLQPA
ncbi:glycosyltransferase family 4 protein [Mesorhizobium sp. M1E.F.Ca.ET.063.01.1.1]|uniref:glycosyltransferase family 4 protein n=1 Tax=Mesorhizobium sp. M1E.F.Ca.ET.063.01.1.1 TaxID=2496750 RepID=UPI000FCB1542|nr:glycosyltransferase family 4 protein [Mesorhizobium sp. M1E.F.Ca.ET.063.01.1.1]RUW85593.1 glycosyltransferase family 1 protein [Mesorhizobium sp. M1E.F.Ca.ET.063.01.1.1]